jgi:hypothetical protein
LGSDAAVHLLHHFLRFRRYEATCGLAVFHIGKYGRRAVLQRRSGFVYDSHDDFSFILAGNHGIGVLPRWPAPEGIVAHPRHGSVKKHAICFSVASQISHTRTAQSFDGAAKTS